MHFHQAAGQRANGRQRDRLVIHQHPAAAARLQFAPQNQLAFVARRHAVLLQPIRPRRFALGGKNGRHQRAVLAGANDVRRGASAQRQSQCIHQDGLAGTRLPGKQVQPRPKLHGQVINDGVVLNVNFAQHGVSAKVYHKNRRHVAPNHGHAWAQGDNNGRIHALQCMRPPRREVWPGPLPGAEAASNRKQGALKSKNAVNCPLKPAMTRKKSMERMQIPCIWPGIMSTFSLFSYTFRVRT